jgi:hypothetical protein
MVPLLLLSAALLSPAAKADDGDAALMKACPGLAAWAATHPRGGGEASMHDAAGRRYTNPALRHELAGRAAADEKARNAAIAAGMQDETANKAVLAVDAGNLSWLKEVVARQGFPGVDAVGRQGVSDAWLLVQHADRDPAFQAAVLETLESRLASSGVRKADVAMLTDRVLRAQGKPQRYASQFMRAKDGSLVPEPIADVAHVDQRRAAMDLMPLADYQCVLRFSYAPGPKAGQ